MSTTRAQTLRALRNWGQPVLPSTLAYWMNRSPQYVSSKLSALYLRGLCDRKPHPRYPHRYLYYPKLLRGPGGAIAVGDKVDLLTLNQVQQERGR
jgi:hypothetical protein